MAAAPLFAPPRVVAETGPDGSVLLRSADRLGDYPATVIHSLRAWADADPDDPLVAERTPGGGWRRCSYGAAVAAAGAIGQALLERGLGPGRPLLVLSGNSVDHHLVTLGALTAGIPIAPIRAAFAAADPDAVAKILFTSGSTGMPEGVLNTHRMLAANQQMIRQVWPFLGAERPVIVDWLPWSHTFGGNHNVNMMLTTGGTLYIDAGLPVPGLFAQTVANLADVPPTLYFNVPAGYAQLVPVLESGPAFAARFFSRLRLLFNAGAALPGGLRDRLGELALQAAGHEIPVTGSWGATETAPAVTTAHFGYADARCIGTPLPGAELKLVPIPAPGTPDDGPGSGRTAGRRYEIRARGPMITPGYFGRADLTAAAVDETGFYRSGDAVSLSDAVITGEERAWVGALAWLNLAGARRQLGIEPQPQGEVIADEAVRKVLAQALAGHNATAGSAARVGRLLVLARAPDLDAGEITDKGYVNQRRVLGRRAALVELLYTEPAPAGVIVAGRD